MRYHLPLASAGKTVHFNTYFEMRSVVEEAVGAQCLADWVRRAGFRNCTELFDRLWADKVEAPETSDEIVIQIPSDAQGPLAGCRLWS